MFAWLLSLFVIINAAGIGSSDVCSRTKEFIPLTTAGFTLPLTTYPKNCPGSRHIFTVPMGYFALVEVHAYQIQQYDIVIIFDIANVEISAGNDYNQIGITNFSNTQVWPSDFEVDVFGDTSNTLIQMSLNITVFPQSPTANIVKSYVTFPGASSAFLYADQWNDGESYKFTSKSGKVYVNAAVSNEDNYVSNYLNNIFVYEGGVFMKTLADLPMLSLEDERPYISSSNEIILYCSKKINFTGTIMVTDYSNLQNLVRLTMKYIPNGSQSLSYQMYATDGDLAVTFVSSRDAPQSFTLNNITHDESSSTGILSYIAGGPIQNHASAMNLTNDQLPKTFTGYANTFYLTGGVYKLFVVL